MTSLARKSIATVFAGTVLAVGVATPASAQPQDGLVNIVVGDVTIAEDVNVAVVARELVEADVCAVIPVNITAIATEVDNRSRTALVCRQEDGDKVRIVQN